MLHSFLLHIKNQLFQGKGRVVLSVLGLVGDYKGFDILNSLQLLAGGLVGMPVVNDFIHLKLV